MIQASVIIRKAADPLPKEAIHTITEMIRAVRYGSVTLIMQDGKLAQIDKTEKFRLGKAK